MLKKIGLMLLCALLVLSCIFVYQHHREILLGWFLEAGGRGNATYEVSLFFMSSMEEKTLRVRMTVCCRDREQRREVLKKEPRIVHGLINAAQQPAVRTSVMQRDLEDLKKHLLGAVNEVTRSPVKDVCLDRFFFN